MKLREVKYNKFIPIEYVIIQEEPLKKGRVEGTGMTETDYPSRGFFHTWGVNYEEYEINTVNYTVALVETRDGTIVEVLPTDLKFID